MLDEGKSMKWVFKNEMCAKGFSDGNPEKPVSVTSAIQKELTPLFVAVAEVLATPRLCSTNAYR